MAPKKKAHRAEPRVWSAFDPLFFKVAGDAGAHPVKPIPFADASMLIAFTKDNKGAFVRGAPGCGKSSLARALTDIAVKPRKRGEEPWYHEVCVIPPMNRAR